MQNASVMTLLAGWLSVVELVTVAGGFTTRGTRQPPSVENILNNLLGLVILSFVGVTLQTSATTAAQFTVGRFISFGMTGMTIVVVPIYQGETAPRVLRGMMTSTLQLMIIFGQLVASLVNYGTQHITTDKGCQIPVGLQFVAPTIILCLLPFMPESPRWLISKDRFKEAKQSLRRIRNKGTIDADIDLEIAAVHRSHTSVGKGTWSEVFDEENRVNAFAMVYTLCTCARPADLILA